MKQILLLDNYDSFTYNLKHYLNALGANVDVIRNDELIDDITLYDAVVLSPGPGLPKESAAMMSLISEMKGIVPILGICLGMQAIVIDYGGELYNQEIVKHGVKEKVSLGESLLFRELPDTIEVGLYHSWAVNLLESDLVVSASSIGGTIMAIEDRKNKIYGVQFHPESVLTKDGMKILKNFLELI